MPLVTMRHHHLDAWDQKHAWPDGRIAEIAARQQTIVTHRQLRELGIRPRTVASAAVRGRLHRVHHGVYSLLLPGARPLLAAEWAALLACGPTALLSHESAAWLLGLSERHPRGVTVTVVATQRRRPGIHVHRVRSLDRRDRDRRGRLPVTSVARTLIDLAPHVGPRALAPLLDRGLRRTSATNMRETLARHPGRPGTPLLIELLDPARPSADAWSRRERQLREMFVRAGIAAPECNVPVGRYTPDLLWRAQRVIVEYDSDEFHAGPAAQRWDTERHNDLEAQGFHVIHVTWQELSTRPERIIAQVAAALARAEA